jgi:thiol-disulfide isomerase/thioredoxin
LAVPSFSLPRLEGAGNTSLEELLNGRRGALVVFWSGVCSHCIRYDDYFNTFSRRHPQLGFVAVASRLNESRSEMLSAVQARGLTFPILKDEGGSVARLWYAQQTPRCYLVGPDRTLYYRGAIDNFKMAGDPEYIGWLEPAVSSFLAGEPIARPETASFGCAIETVYYQIPRQL